ncbi:polyphosphate glucokinase [Enhydrobacter aerosaccus]|uniref:Polyphosphate glucokinase n=1 Tax=Enhydrobacter aerosaccus TaxID=225324 RepID=A0A1T4SQD5_9HYPH|nr:ROK family protein [Enhydrobacter aerosaccus]SKA30402.1 polyphosphate glucokinase [Enhydrobacter aerosaccus]
MKPNDGGPYTLSMDIGGSGLKASVLDRNGHMIVDRVRVATPRNCRPHQMVDLLVELVKPLPAYDRISIGFPGVVRNGAVLTAPHFHREDWPGFPLQQTLADRLGKPARLSNDAEIQGLGIIAGHGLEVVLTLGTGVGSAVFAGGRMTPHLELAHHPIHRDDTYNDYLGAAAFKKCGSKKWNRRVCKMIDIVQTLLNYDTLYLGGGNAVNVKAKLPDNVKIESNDMGIIGGIKLWNDAVWQSARDIGHGGE